MENLSSILNIAIAVLVFLGFGTLLIFVIGVMIDRGMKRDRRSDGEKKPAPGGQ